MVITATGMPTATRTITFNQVIERGPSRLLSFLIILMGNDLAHPWFDNRVSRAMSGALYASAESAWPIFAVLPPPPAGPH